MQINELAEDYRCQAEILDRKIEHLKSRLHKCQGEELYNIRRKIVIYSDMRDECISLYYKLLHYYDKD